MITLVKVIGSAISNGMRQIKISFGGSNVQEVAEVAPHGIDSNPPDNRIAAHANTTVKGINVVYGYYNTKQTAAKGETRIYATNTAGSSVVMYLHLKNDGTANFGGTADNLVRYSDLETGFNDLKSKVNDLITKYNSHTHILTLSAGTGTAAPTATTETPSTSDISGSKINEIKCL